MTDTPELPAEPARPKSVFEGPRAGMVAVALSAVALVVSVAPHVSGGNFDQRVRSYLLQHPELLQEMSAALENRDNQARTDEVNRRAAASPSLLALDPRDPTFGPEGARVTVIEYFDFRCPGCKATAPEVLRLMQAHPDVRFVFRDWPILDREPGGVSHYAARAAQAAHRQGKYLPVFRALMAEGALTEEAVDRILVANGVDLAAAKAAMAGPELGRHLTDINVNALALGLSATPTFFINGRASASIHPEQLDRAIREAKAAR